MNEDKRKQLAKWLFDSRDKYTLTLNSKKGIVLTIRNNLIPSFMIFGKSIVCEECIVRACCSKPCHVWFDKHSGGGGFTAVESGGYTSFNFCADDIDKELIEAAKKSKQVTKEEKKKFFKMWNKRYQGEEER